MSSNPNQSVFKQALEAANAQRDTVRDEMAGLTERLDTLKDLDANLSQTITSLQAILAPTEEDEEDTTTPSLAEPSETPVAVRPINEHLLRGGDGEDTAEHEGPPLPQPPMMSRRVSPDTSPYRVGIILRDHQEPMKRDWIIQEYESRGWLDPKWQGDPTNNISQAIRRAVKYGWARQLPNERHVYVTTQTPDGHTVAGDDLMGGGAWA